MYVEDASAYLAQLNGGGGGYEVTVTATVDPPPPTPSVFQYDLGQGNDLTFSTDYDLVYGAPGFGVNLPPSDALSALLAQATQALAFENYTQAQIDMILAGASYDWIGGHWNLVIDPDTLDMPFVPGPRGPTEYDAWHDDQLFNVPVVHVDCGNPGGSPGVPLGGAGVGGLSTHILVDGVLGWLGVNLDSFCMPPSP